MVPIRRGMEVLGALLFAARPPQVYGDDDVQVGALLAPGLSAGLETSLAYQVAADERSTLAAVLASTADAVLMINQAGVVLLANAAVAPMLGLVPDAITGRPLLEAVDYVPLRQLFAVGRPGTSELTLPDGRTAQASLVPVTTPFGEPVGVAAILRDITLLKNLEQMKNDFVNTVSHDLKNPIMIIAGRRPHAAGAARAGRRAAYRAAARTSATPPSTWPRWSPTCWTSARSRPASMRTASRPTRPAHRRWPCGRCAAPPSASASRCTLDAAAPRRGSRWCARACSRR